MNTISKFFLRVGLAALATAPLCFGAGVSVGVYQPNGVNAAVLPELLKPWAAAAGITVTILKPEDVRMGKFKNVDVLAVADADSHTATLNPDADERKAIQAFVFAGGGYIGICGGCTLALDSNAGLGLLPLQPASVYGLKRGPVPVKLQMTKLTQTILGDDRKFVDATFEDGPVLEAHKHHKLPRRFDHIGLFWEANGVGTAKKNR
ncbi:MAG: hypothetical protein NTY53_19225, partial [Kiritimatiellaeota bacterium]|nr:hypothetical protein [Kiritimatiellota bacterium]